MACTAVSRARCSWKTRRQKPPRPAAVGLPGSSLTELHTPASLARHVADAGQQPAVCRGLCADWPARGWDATRIATALPTIEASTSTSGTFPRDRGAPCPQVKLAAREFLRRLGEQSPHVYCHGNVLPDALVGDCPLPAALEGRAVARRSLWISSSGARSPLHYDLPNVLLCQLRGRKRVWLYSPEHHDRMRPLGSTFPALQAQSRIARAARSELHDVAGMQVDLGPGDAVYMPSGWWHEVESFADGDALGCISVGLNWPSIADALPAFEPWKAATRYPILTQGMVLAQYCGEEKARAMPGYDLPAF